MDVDVEELPTDELRAIRDRATQELGKRDADDKAFASACRTVRTLAQTDGAPAKVSVVGTRIVCEAVLKILRKPRRDLVDAVAAWMDSP